MLIFLHSSIKRHFIQKVPLRLRLIIKFAFALTSLTINICNRNIRLPAYLKITIAADARLSNLDYADDQIWELVQQEGKSPALSLQTTFGLRVRWLRLFPCFIFSDRLVYTSADFDQPPQLLIACPNYLKFNLSPFTNIDTLIEYWVPQSHTVAGRLSFINKGDQPEAFQVCWAGMINPISGDTKLTVNQIGDRYLLHCETNGL